MGLARGFSSVNFKVLYKIVGYWVLTVPIAAFSSIVIFQILNMDFYLEDRFDNQDINHYYFRSMAETALHNQQHELEVFMMKLNFFGLLINKSPMEKLMEHFEKIEQSIDVINEALEYYTGDEHFIKFESTQNRLNDLEFQADNIIRNIRNNLPKSIFMAVNKVQLLSYTTAQDNILDSAREALNWLSMSKVAIPGEFRKDLTCLAGDAGNMVLLLGPALKDTVSLVHLENLDWENANEHYQRIRDKKNEIFKFKHALNGKIYRSEMEFKDIYLLVQFIEKIFAMSQNCGKCAEILRSMIAR